MIRTQSFFKEERLFHMSKREFIKFVQSDKYIQDDRDRKSKYFDSMRKNTVINMIGGIQNE